MPDTARNVLARHLRFLRFHRGWTQEQLAAASGLHRTYISSVERGRRNVGLDNVERLAHAFGISARDLLDVNTLPSPHRHDDNNK
ncbi:MAG: helix-turn-helix domain-containing protein [Acidiferrobacteraceae bacterium]